MRTNLRVIKTDMTAQYIKILYLKHKPGQIGPNIKASLNLQENSHTSQFEEN